MAVGCPYLAGTTGFAIGITRLLQVLKEVSAQAGAPLAHSKATVECHRARKR